MCAFGIVRCLSNRLPVPLSPRDVSILEKAKQFGKASPKNRQLGYYGEMFAAHGLAKILLQRKDPRAKILWELHRDQLIRISSNRFGKYDKRCDIAWVRNGVVVLIDFKASEYGEPYPGVSMSDDKGAPDPDVVYVCVSGTHQPNGNWEFFIHGWEFGHALEAADRDLGGHVYDPKVGRGKWRDIEDLFKMLK